MPTGSRSALHPHAHLTLVTLGSVSLRATMAAHDTAHPGDPGSDDPPRTVPPGVPASPIQVFDVGKPLALITYLACAPEHSAAREHLIDLLWGDVDPEAAKHALRQTLWYIRKRLGDRALIAGGDVLSLVGAVEFDRERLLDAVARGDAEAVVRLYTGDFFPGFAAPGGAEFERWADIERQRLRSFFWLSADTLVRRWMSSGRLRDAQTLARRVRDSDVLREGGWRLLFETFIAAGDTVSGTLEAEAFDRLTDTEGLEPEASTRAMLRAVRQTATATGGGHQLDRPSFIAELVGREQEFSRLLMSWEAARTGRATHVHVLAPAGVGKTRLLTDVNARLRATRARTVFVRASLGARDIPFGFAGDLAEALARLAGASGISTGSARALVSLNPALSTAYPAAVPDASGDASDTLRRRTVAVRELISAVSEEQAIAVFIDDVQWADARSRQLIASVIGALDTARVLVVTASRPTADDLPSGERSQTIRLTPLDAVGVGALLASIAALPSESWAERLPGELCTATGGSPLMILETLQLVIEAGLLERGDAGWMAARPSRLFAALGVGGALRQRVERIDRVERWVLTLLSVAAVPLRQDTLAAAAGRTHDDLLAALGSLERRGLATRHGDAWMPSHDEIAAITVDLASRDARGAAARALGRVMLDRQPGDMRDLRQAGALLAQANDTEALGIAFARFTHLARLAGDRQANRALASDFLGERATPELVGGAVRSLPFSHRVGLYSGQRQSAVLAAMALVPLGIMLNGFIARQPPPDIELAVGVVRADSVASLYRVPLRAADLSPGSIIPVKRGLRPAWTLHADPSLASFARNPRGGSWLVDRVSPDAGGLDIIEVTDDGDERRLTHTFGDDHSPNWSPDGRYVAYVSARWDTASRYDIAVQDVRTGHVRRLTSGDALDTSPLWSTDGSRIAFARQYWTGNRRLETCVVGLDGGPPRCFAHPSGQFAPLGGWSDADHLIVQVVSNSRRMLGRLDVTSGAVDTIATLTASSISVSPDARWVACHCQRTGFRSGAVLVFPLDEPNRIVELDVSRLPQDGQLKLGWAPIRGVSRWVHRLTIDTGLGAPIVGVPHGLTARGASLDGQDAPIGPVQWRSLDTAIATIDPDGTLLAKQTGVVRVEASLSGWRIAHATLDVRAPHSVVLMREDWSAGIGPAWIPFGVPRPRVDSTDGMPAFVNGGDGSFVSGVYSDRSFPTSGGLSLDAWISDSVTSVHWQVASVTFDGSLDDASLRRWSHLQGNLPRRGSNPPSCSLTYPGPNEGDTYGDSISANTGRPAIIVTVPAPREFKFGAWVHVRAQIFPDGRCGIAVNGVPLAVSEPRSIPDSAVRVLTYGNSNGTKVMIGPVTVRSGVQTDIDWTRIGAPLPNVPPPGWRPAPPRVHAYR